jgi:hypothetical protein
MHNFAAAEKLLTESFYILYRLPQEKWYKNENPQYQLNVPMEKYLSYQ